MNYAAHYDKLIARARERVLSGYVERHHVKPRCMGGGDELWNLVALTPEEHFVAHLLLHKMHPLNNGLALAAWQMAQTREGLRVGARTYGALRREAGLAISRALTGKPKTAAHVEAVAAKQRGRKLSAAHNEASHAPLRGRKQTPEAVATRTAAIRASPKRFRTCPHCGKTGGAGPMARYHFDHCPSVVQNIPDLIQ